MLSFRKRLVLDAMELRVCRGQKRPAALQEQVWVVDLASPQIGVAHTAGHGAPTLVPRHQAHARSQGQATVDRRDVERHHTGASHAAILRLWSNDQNPSGRERLM